MEIQKLHSLQISYRLMNLTDIILTQIDPFQCRPAAVTSYSLLPAIIPVCQIMTQKILQKLPTANHIQYIIPRGIASLHFTYSPVAAQNINYNAQGSVKRVF